MGTRALKLTAQDRRRQIMNVATALFARQGYKGTTTRQIAERARVNEAIIFRHFAHKEDLYWAIIDEKCRAVNGRAECERQLSSREDERDIFASMAEHFIRRNAKDTRLSRLLIYSALENHRLSHRFFRTFVAGRYEVLAEYISERIQRGRFRKVDPLLAARGFLGMVFYHFMVQELLGGKRLHPYDTRQAAEALADIWLHGMLVHEKAGSATQNELSEQERGH
jgi:AcrR family transcriptional regulator